MSEDGNPGVLFMCPNLEAGGAERQWSVLIPGLRDAGLPVSVLTLDGRGVFFDELAREGISTAFAGLRHRADAAGLRRVQRLARRAKPEVIVTRSLSADVLGHALARRLGCGHVITEHLGPRSRSFRPLRRHQRWLEQVMRPRARAVVAVSAGQTDELVASGYRRDRIRIIPNGVANDPPVRSRELVLAELGMPGDAFLAVMVATLRPEKRAEAFVAAVAAAAAAGAGVRGLVVGDGPDAPLVARRVSDSDGVVRMLGYRDDALDIINAGDALCLTSAVEAMPMAALEAMSVGRPVVATAVGGVPEVVEHTRTGLLVPGDRPEAVGSAILALASDRAWAAALGDAGRERQQRLFSVSA
ncbi:MAG TPA: glycosyltransferase family 4 protein, partial [Gaiellales bacterium]|nr:glycosyltransferase family 4 protein [Gaiellales bacterium]